jgi:glycerol-3-phosphate acyltransferase PlsY
MVLNYLLSAVIGYLLGCVSFGYLAGKLFKGKDIREVGSGNAGTANVIRNYGWAIGLLTFFGDVAKGVGAALIGGLIVPQIGMNGLTVFGMIEQTGVPIGVCIGGLAVVIGHIWPVFLKFRGGKGVATSLGVFLIIMPVHAAIVMGVCIVIIALTRTMSIGSLIGTMLMVVASFLFFWGDMFNHITCILLLILVYYSHRKNIKRLAEGKENQL